MSAKLKWNYFVVKALLSWFLSETHEINETLSLLREIGCFSFLKI